MAGHRKNIFDISALISGFLLGKLTEKEEGLLDQWKRESEHNRWLFEEVCNEKAEYLKKYSGNAFEEAFLRFVSRRRTVEKAYRRKLQMRRWAYAAAFFLPLFIGSVAWYIFHFSEAPVAVEPLPSFLFRKYPVLTLSDGQSVVLTAEKQLLQDSVDFSLTFPDPFSLAYPGKQSETAALDYRTLTTPSQCDYCFLLSDGTRVWMNAESSVKFPVTFSELERVISVSGEVYLEVAKDSACPFYVKTFNDQMVIRVVGTSFNVNSYPEEECTTVTLCNGKVEVCMESGAYRLNPEQQFHLHKTTGKIEIKRVNPDDYTSWRTGSYVFHGQPLREVVKVLEKWYGIEIRFKNEEDKNTVYTGVVIKEESLSAFLHVLNKVSHCRCRLEGKVVYVE